MGGSDATEGGRRASAGNALTHALTARLLRTLDKERIEEVAQAFLGGSPRSAAAWEAATRAAEAHVDVLRIEAECLRLTRAAEDDANTFAEEKPWDRKAELILLRRGWSGRSVAGAPLRDLIFRKYRGAPRDATRRHAVLLRKVTPKLVTLGRYAAAARARRRQAIEALDRILAGVTTSPHGERRQ
jgi:hypothetical protein